MVLHRPVELAALIGKVGPGTDRAPVTRTDVSKQIPLIRAHTQSPGTEKPQLRIMVRGDPLIQNKPHRPAACRRGRCQNKAVCAVQALPGPRSAAKWGSGSSRTVWRRRSGPSQRCPKTLLLPRRYLHEKTSVRVQSLDCLQTHVLRPQELAGRNRTSLRFANELTELHA